MMAEQELRDILSSLRSYLEYLQESGVDGLPLETPHTEEMPPVALFPEPLGLTREDAQRNARDDSGQETLERVREELGECRRCRLGETRTQLVFGVGDSQARLVFVGEAPGRDEDLQGEPFVGEAGQLLTRIIQAMGFKRSEVYICNVLKCRPPENRNPTLSEIEQCHPFLLLQLKAIGPAVVVALGTFAAQTLLATKDPISRLRGRFHDYQGIPLMPTFHPAFLLRNPAMKKQVWEDMQQVMRLLETKLPQKKE